ncbi:hypothetical protein [Nocardia cyriacigeorgica]|uniref:hypothetical protein n=1 Tax=Nocardia cyriacigeorgica TaxID=135487 RepID=UPI0024588123|nr:hypothetical protein [Nocardia cyriacigeorgica]
MSMVTGRAIACAEAQDQQAISELVLTMGTLNPLRIQRFKGGNVELHFESGRPSSLCGGGV